MDVRNYTALSHPTAFSGVNQLSRYYGSMQASRRDIERNLSGVKSYTLMREAKKPKPNPLYVWQLRELLQADLNVRIALEKGSNDGVNYILVVIDTFSRKIWLHNLVRKTAKDVAAAFRTMMQREIAHPNFPVKRLLTDRGREFTGAEFQTVLADYNIEHTLPINHAPHVERVQRSLQSLLGFHGTEHDTDRWVDQVQLLARTSNNRYHSTIKMTPNEAELVQNHDKVRRALAEAYSKQEAKANSHNPKYKVGDLVRYALTKHRMFRSFHERFSRQICQISEVHTNLPRVMYQLVDAQTGVEVRGKFYQEQLQKVSRADL